MHVGAAELLGGDFLPGCRLHERRPGQENRPALHDHGLVRHRGDVRAPRRARPHDDRNLRDPFRRHSRLVEEDAPEVFAVREDLGLQRQEGAARIHEVHARQAVLERDLLRAHVLLDRDGVVGAALDGGVVGDDQHLTPRHAADAGDDAGCRGAVVVQVPRGQRGELQERRAVVQQLLNPVAGRELALLAMPLDVLRAAPLLHERDALAKLGHKRGHARRSWSGRGPRPCRPESRSSPLVTRQPSAGLESRVPSPESRVPSFDAHHPQQSVL